MPILLAACLSLLTFQIKTVSIDSMTTVANLVALVGEQTHESLKVDPEIGVIHAYVRADHVPLDEFKEWLASVTHATWTTATGAKRLYRTKLQARLLEEDWSDVLTEQIIRQGSVGRSGLPENPRQGGIDYGNSLRAKLSQRNPAPFYGPADGLLQEILRTIGAQNLAGIPLFKIVLLSNRPTAPETQLPDVTPLIERYKEVSKVFAKSVSEESMKGLLDEYDFNRIVASAHRSESVGRVLVRLLATFRSIYANLTIYDELGGQITDATWAMRYSTPVEASSLPNPGRKLEWPKVNLEAFATLKRGHLLTSAENSLDSFLQEPLKLQAIPGLQLLANEHKANIICPLPDDVVSSLNGADPKTIGEFCAAMSSGGVQLYAWDNWVFGQLRPGYSDPARFLDRSSLAAYAHSSLDCQTSWLRRMSSLYGSSGNAASNGLVSWIQRCFWPVLGVREPISQTPRWLLFALGTLNPSEWEDLQQGRSVSATYTTTRAAQIEQWSWQSSDSLERTAGTVCPDAELMGSVAFPGGPPEGTTITISPIDSRLVQTSNGQDSSWMNIDQLANWACEASVPRPSSVEAAMSNLKGKFNLAIQPGSKITVHLGPRFILTCSQAEKDISVTNQSLSVSDWPTDVMTQLKIAIRDYLAQRASRSLLPPP